MKRTFYFSLIFIFTFLTRVYAIEMKIEPYDIAPFSAIGGKTNVPVISMLLYAPGGTLTWSGLKVYLIGTNAVDSDVLSVKLYRENGTTPGFQPSEDTLITSGTFSGGTALLSFSQSISPSPLTYYVVYDIAPVPPASLTHNVGARLGSDSFTVNSPNTVNATYLPFSSKEIDLVEGRPSIVSLNYVVHSCDKVTLTLEFNGDENGNSETRFQYCVSTSCTWIDACASVRGASPRTCTVVRLNLNNENYNFQAIISDPDGINGPPSITAGPTAGCSTTVGDIPTVNILYPKSGDIVSGNSQYPVKIRVSAWDAETPAPSLTLQLRINNGTWTSGFTYNPSITDQSGNLYVFEYNWVPPQPGMYRIAVRAIDGNNNYGYAFKNSYVYVNSVTTYNVGGRDVFVGTGNLLVREEGDLTCIACHAVSTHGGYVWGSTKYGYWATGCRTCHTPHGTTNIYLIREAIETPNSGIRSVVFKALSGTPGNPNSGVLGDDTDGVYTNICEVCHTKTKYHRNDASTPNPNHQNAADCTSCHKHALGFKPGGESSGGQSCETCHSDLFNPMNSDATTYHHYLVNANASYPVISNPSLIGIEDPNRNCLICHTDHDLFNPSLNPNNTMGRAANLRTSISTAPNQTSGYTNTDFSSASVSICISCHTYQMTKNTTKRKSDGTTQTMIVSGSDFQASSHNYSVQSTFGSDNSTFYANCSKCHSDLLNPKSSVGAQTSTYKFGPHYSPLRWLLYKLGISNPSDPIEESFCYECHSGGTAGNDYYGVKSMTKRAKSIKGIMTDPNHLYLHPVTATTGSHKAVEGSYGWQPSTARHVECTDCHNPHSASQGNHTDGQGGIGNANKGVWGVQIVSFGTTYSTGTANFTNNSNTVTGNGTNWTNAFNGCNIKNNNTGIVYRINTVSNATQLTLIENYRETSANNQPYTIMCPKTTWGTGDFNRVENSSNQYEICFKCHTQYGWGSSPPNATWWGQAQTNVASDFNPYNLAYHPLFAPGRNQPPNNANTNWSSSGGRKSNTSAKCPNANPNQGLDNTFVDCWGKSSLVTCSDCHDTDAPGNDVPEGPHASAYRWILKGIDPNVTVTLYNGTVVYPNQGAKVNPYNFCLNCHRRDVYGDRWESTTTTGSYRNLSRWAGHPDNASCYGMNIIDGDRGVKVYPIPCLNCHGGRGPGGIHGSNLGKGSAGNSAQGFRFMNGASWQGHTTTLTGGTCYTIGAANNLSTCTQHSGGRTMSNATYQY